jgi:peroxiredoxin
MRSLLDKTLYSSVLVISALLVSGPLSADIGQGPAPDFTLKSQAGDNHKLSELRGEVVMINFWASWCGPCRQEMPKLEELYVRYKPLGFTVLGVNIEEDNSKAKALLEDLSVSFPVLFDDQNEVSRLYQVAAMPSTVLVDRDGNMRYLHKGYQPGLELQYQEQIRTLIKE